MSRTMSVKSHRAVFLKRERRGKAMKKILFQGDSTTDCCRYYSDPNNIGSGYVLLVQAILDRKYPKQYACINRGRGGDRVSDLYARERIDGICLKPDVASFLVGVNDVLCRWLNNDNGSSQKRYRDIYKIMLEDYLNDLPDLKIIILEPFILPGRITATTPEQLKIFTDDVYERARISREVADEFNVPFIPLQKRFTEEAEKYGADYVLSDGVHPTTFANKIIAQEWVKCFERG